MIIDGKSIAENILTKLRDEVSKLQKHGTQPCLAVILVGSDPGSLSYIKQKQKAAERIGATLILKQFPDSVSPEELANAISRYNNDPKTHGLIVQRPIPQFVNTHGTLTLQVLPAKDVDGFVNHSPFQVPVARAVITILSEIHAQLVTAALVQKEFTAWLQTKSIAVIGKGETAGGPITSALQTYNCTTSIIDSKTLHPEHITKQSDIIISCVGKQDIITKHMISNGVILISVGLTRDAAGKLHGDYKEEDIAKIASFYTPTPGGVGPVNVACLMQNLIEAAQS